MTEADPTRRSSAPENQKQPLLVFYDLHLTTRRDFASMVRRACGNEHFINLDQHAEYQHQRPFNQDFFRALRAKETTLRGVVAHRVVPDIHLSPDLHVFPIVFLRHPLLHAIALYDSLRNRKTDWPGKELIMRLELAPWIDWCLEPEQKNACKNFQSCLLSIDNNGRVLAPRGRYGILDKPGFHARPGEIAGPEKARLTARRGRLLIVQERLDAVPVVGIAEQMEKSIFLLNRETKSRGLALSRPKSAGKEANEDWRRQLRDAERSLPSETLNRFYDANEDDLLLWERYFSKLAWADPVSHWAGGDARDDRREAAEEKPKTAKRKKNRPAETIPGLDEQL